MECYLSTRPSVLIYSKSSLGKALPWKAASKACSRLNTEIKSIMVHHDLTKYWNELVTSLNALIIWFIMPRVIVPNAIVGMRRT